jgi:hypothetical protein
VCKKVLHLQCKTAYFKHSFNLSELQINNILSAVKAGELTCIRLTKDSFENSPNTELPLTKNDADKVLKNKPFTYQLTKAKMKFLNIDEKSGGLLPIPLILGILGGLATATTAGATVAKTVLDKKTNDAKLMEEQRHNLELEKAARGESQRDDPHSGTGLHISTPGSGLYLQPWKSGASIAVKDFVKSTKLDSMGQKTFRCFLKNLHNNVKIEKHGDGIFLSPRM